MSRFFLMAIFSLALTACDTHDKPLNTSHAQEDADNTGRNVRDRDNTLTPGDQSESEADRTLTQKIRQALMADKALSSNGKNVKIMTINGVVTLRGPVANSQERDDIARKVKNIQGIARIDNQLEVTHSN